MTRTLVSSVLAVVGLMAPAFALAQQTPPVSPAPKTVVQSAAPVNLNTATKADLEKLPGVGPSMAQRILDYRQKNGSFKKTEELMNVQGIGEKSFLKLRPLVTVAPPKTTEQ
jgi:competence protein ComEA